MTVQPPSTQAGSVADRLGSGHKEHDRDRNDRSKLKLGRISEKLREGENAHFLHGVLHGGEIDHAGSELRYRENDCKKISDQQAEKHVKLLPEPLGHALVYKAGQQRHARDGQILPRAALHRPRKKRRPDILQPKQSGRPASHWQRTWPKRAAGQTEWLFRDVIDSGTFHGRGSHDICLPLVFLGSFSLPLEFA